MKDGEILNPVLSSTAFLVENPRYVHINDSCIKAAAKSWSNQDIKLPEWKDTVFPDKTDDELIDFMLVANSINFAFNDFETWKKFSTMYKDKKWVGAYALYACLKRAMESGIPILQGPYLEQASYADFADIFAGHTTIPMLNERHAILNEVGRVLTKKHKGRFRNLVKECDQRLFNFGNGLVERLVSEFPSFDDHYLHEGRKVVFNKRAQLGAAMIFERFRAERQFYFHDARHLTVFADYVLPKALRGLGILIYSPELSDKVDSRVPLEPGSRMELELRAATVHAARRIEVALHAIGSMHYSSLHIDYKLWAEGRALKDAEEHRCKTTFY